MVNWFSYITSFELVKVDSPLNGEIKVVESFGKRILLVNDAEQSGGTITGMWEKTIKKIRNPKSEIQKCLVLGLGGGTVIHILKKYYPEITIDVIEFDPVIIQIYLKYFTFKKVKPNIICADAFTWIQKARNKYDLVIFDLFLGKFNPPVSRKEVFLMRLKKLLSDEGFILFNAHYQSDEDNFRLFFKSCQKVFGKAQLILRYPYSRILLLGKQG